MSAKADLQEAYNNCALALKALYLNPRPDLSYGGRSYSWNGLRSSLIKEMRELQMAIQDADVAEGGAFEVQSYGR